MVKANFHHKLKWTDVTSMIKCHIKLQSFGACTIYMYKFYHLIAQSTSLWQELIIHAMVVIANPTFPLNAALGFCDFGGQWSNGPRYTMAPYGIFWVNGATEYTATKLKSAKIQNTKNTNFAPAQI